MLKCAYWDCIHGFRLSGKLCRIKLPGHPRKGSRWKVQIRSAQDAPASTRAADRSLVCQHWDEGNTSESRMPKWSWLRIGASRVLKLSSVRWRMLFYPPSHATTSHPQLKNSRVNFQDVVNKVLPIIPFRLYIRAERNPKKRLNHSKAQKSVTSLSLRRISYVCSQGFQFICPSACGGCAGGSLRMRHSVTEFHSSGQRRIWRICSAWFSYSLISKWYVKHFGVSWESWSFWGTPGFPLYTMW